MRAPLEQAVLSLGLREMREGQGAPLHAALHPSATCLALARGTCLAVLPLGDAAAYGAAAPPVRSHKGAAAVTCLAWFAVLRQPLPHEQRDAREQQQRRQRTAAIAAAAAARTPPGRHSSTATAALGGADDTDADARGDDNENGDVTSLESLLECETLLVGTRDGFLQLHDRVGATLFRQRLHPSAAVVHIAVRPYCTGLRPDEAAEDVTVTFADSVARVSAIDLRSHLRQLALARANGGGGAGASGAVPVPPLPHQRWELPSGVGARASALCAGHCPGSLYSLLSSSGGAGGGGGRQRQRLRIVTTGARPPIASFEVDEAPGGRGALAKLGAAAAGVVGMARGAAQQVASIGPGLVASGVRAYIIAPLASWAGLSGGAGAELPAVAYDDAALLPKPEAASLSRQLADDARHADALVAAPRGALAAAPDALGRVVLLDCGAMLALRLWKGYRDAQCGWAAPTAGHALAAHGLLLVLYAPKRQSVEVWAARSGARVGAVRVERPCRLLPAAPPCGGWGNVLAAGWRRRCPETTYALDLEDGAVWDVLERL